MGTDCVPLVANLFLSCYDRHFMMSLSDDKQADIIIRCLDDILSIYNVYFDNTVSQIYPSELQLKKKLIPLKLNQRFKTCICPFLMILFLPKFMINVTILILKLLISQF